MLMGAAAPKACEAFGGSWIRVTQSQRAMRKHAKRCWGDDMVLAADKAVNTNDVRSTTIKGPLNPQSITAAFKSKGKGKSHVLTQTAHEN
jgi:hypothetical protein